MKYLLVGYGSIGKRHHMNIIKNDPDALITIWHLQRKKPAVPLNNSRGGREVFSFEDAINPKPDVAFITCPASHHMQIASILANEGIDLFIEKPLSNDIAGIDNLVKTANEKKSIIMVGYNLRFHPPLQAMKKGLVEGMIGSILSIRAEVGQYLPDWRPGIDYRSSVSASKELGGGAVLELSHELDYVRWMVGEVRTVSAYIDHLSDLEIDVEDTAEIILRFTNGAIGSVHLDMVQRSYTRYCRVIGTEGTMIWDGTDDSVKCYQVKTQDWSILYPAGKPDWNAMYVNELASFLQCAKKRENPEVDGTVGKRVVEIALAALQAAREQKGVRL